LKPKPKKKDQKNSAKSEKEPFPEPKWRNLRHIILYFITYVGLTFLGIHGFLTEETIMIFGNQENQTHLYGFAFVYLILGVHGLISIYFDWKTYKERKKKGLFDKNNSPS